MGESCGGVEPAVPPLCPSLCGNGVRDTCLARTYGFCPPTYWTESCDGTDFGADSCWKEGFAGGPLTCTTACATDVSSCNECFALDASLVRCGSTPLGDVGAGSLAIAATDSEVGLAWVEYDGEDNATLSFERLSPAFEPIGVTVLDDHVPPDVPFPAIRDVAAAALPSGWVLAVFEGHRLSVRALDAHGAETGRAVVDTAADGIFVNSPLLAEQPSAGPLLVWGTDTTLRASVIAADGRSTTAPVDLPMSDVALYDPPSAAFVGDAFYVAVSILTMGDERKLRLVRLGVDGKIASTTDALPGEPIWMPNLASGASDLRIAYAGPATGISGDPLATLWRRLDPKGQPLTPQRSQLAAGPPVILGPSFAFGNDTVVFAFGLDGPSITFVRIASDGSIVTPPHDIVRSPYLSYGAARQGSDVVVGWGGARGFQLARVAP